MGLVVADSTQLESFSKCPQRWAYRWNESLELAEGDKRALQMGGFGHKLLEIYYKNMISLGPSVARDLAMAYDPNRFTRFAILADYKVVPLEDNSTGYAPKDVLDFNLVDEDISLIKTRFNEYWMTVIGRGVDFIPDSPEAVEVGFSNLIQNTPEERFILEGKLDGLGTLEGLHGFIDHKFQLRPRSIYRKTIQFRNYAMVSKSMIGIINYIRFTKGVSNVTFERELASFTPVEHSIWKNRLISLFRRMDLMISSGNFTREWGECRGEFGYPCDYTPLCEEWDNNIIEAKKQSLYKIGEPWRPW